MANERKTENLLKNTLLEINKNENILFEEQMSDSDRIKKLLGRKKPEHIITHTNIKDMLIITECKASNKDHKRAETELVEYSDLLYDNFNLVLIAASGDNKNNFKTTVFIRKLSSTSVIETQQNIISFSAYNLYCFKNKNDKNITENEILVFAKKLHQYMYDKAKLSEEEKPLLVAAILIALMDPPFSASYKQHKNPKKLCLSILFSVKNVIEESNIQTSKIDNMLYPFQFIAQHNILTNNYDILVNIIEMLENMFPTLTITEWDFVGKFYGEFLRYVAGNKQTLGIVLTPTHITDLMTDLIYLNKDTVILDTCTGTGGFLISAMNKMISMANHDSKKIKNIKQNQMVGIEQQSNMFALACSNMILRGDGKANLILASCFQDEDYIKNLSDKYKFTAGVANPPYNQKGTLTELHFVENGLKYLQPNGLFAFIVPISCAIKNSLKDKLLQMHTLEAVMTMPRELFSPVAVRTCIMVFRAGIPHPVDYPTWLALWKDDGFVLTTNNGRYNLDKKWEGIKQQWITSYKNKEEIPYYSLKKVLTSDDEWCADAYISADYTNLSIQKFKSKKNNFESFMAEYNLQFSKYDFVNIETWKDFKYSDIFNIDIISGYDLRTCKKNIGDNIYITAKTTSNGVACYTSLQTKWDSNCITIAADGDENGTAFYQPIPFSGQTCFVLKPKTFKLTENIGLFFATIISLEKERFDYGYKLSKDRIYNRTIKIPCNQTGEIDFDFINSFMKML